jgi:peroxiredoxin
VGAPVLGISPDPVAKVKRFHEKFDLNFPLLADEDHAVAESYGVWTEKSMYGRTFWGVLRTTFIIDAGGKVARVLRNVKPATHDEQVLAVLLTQVVNAADGWPVTDPGVRSALVVVLEPVWQGSVAVVV